MHIHIENDSQGPEALYLTANQLQESLRRAGIAVTDLQITDNSVPSLLNRFLSTADVVIAGRKFDMRAAVSVAKNLRWMQVLSAGVESWLKDWPEQVTLTNASGVHGEKGAEFILTAALMFNYGIPGFISDKMLRLWRPTFGGPAKGKKVTLLGVGGIGKAAVLALNSRGYEVTGVTRSGECDANVSRCIATQDIDSVLPTTDILVSTLPLTPQTANLIDRRRLRLLPAHSCVVVVGRAAVFDYDALADLLTEGHLAGAVLDVYPQEPLPAAHRLWDCPRLIMTPHCSLDDHDSYLQSCLDIFITNLRLFVAGEPLTNQVGKLRGY